MKETLIDWFGNLGKDLKEFAKESWKDFKHCWQVYPNVLIIMGLVTLVAFFV
jgi:hypothetical protein